MKEELIEYIMNEIRKLEVGAQTSISQILGSELLRKCNSVELFEIYNIVKEACDRENIILNTQDFDGKIVGLPYTIPFIKELKSDVDYINEAKNIELKRSSIKKFMDEKYKTTKYYQKTKDKKQAFFVNEEMSLKDLDFIDILKGLFLNIKANYDGLSLTKWVPSKRQEYLLESINSMIDDMVSNAFPSNRYYIEEHSNFYWEVWDYFDDYNNVNEEISKEEMNSIMILLEKFFNYFDDKIISQK